MKNVLITAGPTREKIDAIRFIQNTSTGKLGVEIAKEASKRGYDVVLLYGPGTARVPKYLNRINFLSTKELLDEVLRRIRDVDIFISAAAVADYSPYYIDKKIQSGEKKITIELHPNPKIIKEARKKAKKDTIFVTFKLELGVDENTLIERARTTGGDIIVANDLKMIEGKHHPALIIHGDKILKVEDKRSIANNIFDIISDILEEGEKNG